jgi:hypothetical protein
MSTWENRECYDRSKLRYDSQEFRGSDHEGCQAAPSVASDLAGVKGCAVAQLIERRVGDLLRRKHICNQWFRDWQRPGANRSELDGECHDHQIRVGIHPRRAGERRLRRATDRQRTHWVFDQGSALSR